MEWLTRNSTLQLSLKDLNQIIAWSDRSFGRGYLNLHYLKALSKKAIWITYRDADVLKAGALLLKQTASEIPTSLQAKGLFNEELVLYRKFVIVDPSYRSMGISEYLMQEIDEQSEEYPLIYTSIWQKPGIEKYSEQLQTHGYERGELLENYWKEDSMKRKFVCATCQDIPCTCSARLYYKLNS